MNKISAVNRSSWFSDNRLSGIILFNNRISICWFTVGLNFGYWGRHLRNAGSIVYSVYTLHTTQYTQCLQCLAHTVDFLFRFALRTVNQRRNIRGDLKRRTHLNGKRGLNTRQTVGSGFPSSLLALRVDLRGLRSKLSSIRLTISYDSRKNSCAA
jgi:hypothetical protein